jgi:hypothetical protein
MALANLIGNYTAGQNAIASDVLTDLTSLTTRVNSVTSEQIGASQVLESHINALAITVGKLAAGALTADATGLTKMADGYITRAKLAADAKVSYVQCVDEQTSGTDGGTATGSAWTVLPINTIYDNPDSLAVSIATNAITLPAGSYYMRYTSLFYFARTDIRIRLYNNTDAAVQTNTGANAMYSLSGYNQSQQNYSVSMCGAFTLASAKALQFEYYVGSGKTTVGLGLASSNEVELYRTAEFWKYSD